MNIYLNNIGVICDSRIDIDGITVITGLNNSGKTTVGKVVNALFSAVEDLEFNAHKDKAFFIYSRALRCVRGIIPISHISGTNGLSLSSSLGSNINEWLNIVRLNGLEDISNWCTEATVIFQHILEASDDQIRGIFKERYRDAMSVRLINARASGEVENAIKEIDRLSKLIYDDPDSMIYADRMITKQLQNDFYNQIIPVRYKDKTGEIYIKENNSDVFNIQVVRNEVAEGKHLYNYINNTEVDRTILIEDSDILDGLHPADGGESLFRSYVEQADSGDYYQSISAKDKKKKLANCLFASKSVYQEIGYEEQADRILKKIGMAFDDEMVVAGNKTVCAGSKLDVRNLAAGAKVFALIKQLLLRGQLDQKTLLILDEPDNHLHPEWQILLGEVLFLLNHELGVKILLTTHSTNLIYAFEVIQKRESVKNINVYTTAQLDDEYSVNYRDVTDDYSEVYRKLGDPFIRLRREESKYANR